MPNLHPLCTHFPIALFTVSFLFDLLGIVLKREMLSRAGWLTLATGTLGLLGTLATGLLAKGSIVLSSTASDAFESHQQFAFLVAGIAAVCLFWRVSTRTQVPERKFLYLVLLAILVVVTWVAAWYGGELVYRYGAGVESLAP